MSSSRLLGKNWPIVLLLLTFSVGVRAQIAGVVLDAADGGPVPMASLVYRGNKVAVKAGADGHFQIAHHNGWRLTVSAVGYVPQVITIGNHTPPYLIVRLKRATEQIDEVTVESRRRSKYSRKDNPAVELMRKVIAAKKKTDLRQHDYYRYYRYRKIMMGINDLQTQDLTGGIFRNRPWLLNHVEVCQYNDKLILPLTVEETVTEQLYRREPHTEKSIVRGQTASGVNDLFQTGDILNALLKEYFQDIDIYDDHIRLFQYPFTSPVGRDAVRFYRYYITDTTYVGTDRCYQIDFTPNNQQDFGFRGQLWVLADSSWQVRRCELAIPGASGVNWVENLKCVQEFALLPGGERVLTVDDMLVELTVAKWAAKALVVRTTRRTGYTFDELPPVLLRGRKTVLRDPYAEMRGDDFWNHYRQVELTRSERSMDELVRQIEQLKGFRYIIFALRALIENFVETGTEQHPSKVDIGPVNTIVSQNYYDTWRLRASGQTTANLHPHLFLKGYYARGMKSNENYYDAQLTYTLNRPGYLPREFPRQAVTIESARDVCLPSDQFIQTDKDNMFTSVKIARIDKMFLYHRQSVSIDYEQEWGLKLYGSARAGRLRPVGNITFTPLAPGAAPVGALRTAEVTLGVRYAPGETFVNTKQHRWTLNFDAPVFRLEHTVGLTGVLGARYRSHHTEGEVYKRVWLPMSLGRIDTRIKFGAQWSQVPFPLLIVPAANLGYILEDQTFNLINNMEFLNDRYLSAEIGWDMNGKLLNRVPLLRRLKWREFVGVKCLWGRLTDKNNPLLACNQSSQLLMQLPGGSYVMDGRRPYWELSLGVHNIFRLLHVEYVRRLSYLGLPTATRQAVKFTFRASF